MPQFVSYRSSTHFINVGRTARCDARVLQEVLIRKPVVSDVEFPSSGHALINSV